MQRCDTRAVRLALRRRDRCACSGRADVWLLWCHLPTQSTATGALRRPLAGLRDAPRAAGAAVDCVDKWVLGMFVRDWHQVEHRLAAGLMTFEDAADAGDEGRAPLLPVHVRSKSARDLF